MAGGDAQEDESRSVDEMRQRLAEIEAALEQHPALRRMQEMEEMDRALQWYMRNAAALLLVIESLNQNHRGEILFIQDEVAWDDDDHREFVIELGLGWHNFVAAAMMLTDHMKHLFADQPEDLKAEYEQKRDEIFAAHDVIDFVHKSRHILLHRGVFNTGVTWRFDRSGTNLFEVSARTDILLNRYKSWWKSVSAKRYIRSKAPRINLANVVNEYSEVVGDDLYDWYDDRFYEYHFPSLSEFEALSREYREINEWLEPGSMPPADPSAHFLDPESRRRGAEAEQQSTKPPPKRPRRPAAKKRRRR
jgi:hypothetical protein